MQYLASTESDAVSPDISNASGQALRTTREQKICCNLQQGMVEAGLNVYPRQLLMAETEVYGLISGPSWL
eukprot:4120017-Karenia_brevis.AAC.1